MVSLITEAQITSSNTKPQRNAQYLQNVALLTQIIKRGGVPHTKLGITVSQKLLLWE